MTLREWAEGSLRYPPDERGAPDPADVLELLDWVDRVDAMARRWARDLDDVLAAAPSSKKVTG